MRRARPESFVSGTAIAIAGASTLAEIGVAGVLALLVALGSVGPAAAIEDQVPGAAGRDAADTRRAIARVEAAFAAHPDEPALAFVLARQLARAGEAKRARAATRHLVARWPEYRPSARLEIAQVLLDHGGAAAARSLLDEEVRRVPDSGPTHFSRGLALRMTGDPDGADRALQTAARLEPALRSESLLLRALVLFDLRREPEAVSLLQELLRIDPTSDTAVRARLLLRDREIAQGRQRIRADALAGFEWDDNVTLEGRESETPASNREDIRGVFGAGLSGQPWLGERGGLLLGVRYDQTHHDDLNDFDMIQYALFASLSLQPSEALGRKLALRFDASAYDTLQDLDRALTGGSLRSNLLYSLGPRAGILRVFSVFEFAEFHGDPLFDAWERDSLSGGLGVEHNLALPLRGSSLALSVSWLRSVTEARPGGNSDGFDGDFDHDAYRLRGLVRLALPFAIHAQLEASYSRDEYLNDNLALAFLSLGEGDPEIEPRADDVASGRVALSRFLFPHVRAEAYWRGTYRRSNVSLFDYDKQIVGLLLHVTTN